MYCRCDRPDCLFCNPFLPQQAEERKHSFSSSLRQPNSPQSGIYKHIERLASRGERVRIGTLRAGRIEHIEALIKALPTQRDKACLIMENNRQIPLNQIIFLNDKLINNPFSQKGMQLKQ